MQEPTETVKTTTVASNGNGQPIHQPTSRSPAVYQGIGRLFEILAILFFTACIAVWGLSLDIFSRLTLSLSLLILFPVAYKIAIHYAVSAKRAEEALEYAKTLRLAEETARSSALKHQVTSARLRTLEESGVPPDVTIALAKLKHAPPLPADKFLEKIALDPSTDLGWARTNEFKDKILKYTQLDRMANSTNAASGANLPYLEKSESQASHKNSN